VSWCRNSRIVERGRVCLWEANRWCTVGLEDFSIRQCGTTSSAIAFPAPTSKILLAFLFVPLDLPVAEVVKDRGEGGDLIQGAGSGDIEAGEEGSSQILVLET